MLSRGVEPHRVLLLLHVVQELLPLRAVRLLLNHVHVPVVDGRGVGRHQADRADLHQQREDAGDQQQHRRRADLRAGTLFHPVAPAVVVVVTIPVAAVVAVVAVVEWGRLDAHSPVRGGGAELQVDVGLDLVATRLQVEGDARVGEGAVVRAGQDDDTAIGRRGAPVECGPEPGMGRERGAWIGRSLRFECEAVAREHDETGADEAVDRRRDPFGDDRGVCGRGRREPQVAHDEHAAPDREHASRSAERHRGHAMGERRAGPRAAQVPRIGQGTGGLPFAAPPDPAATPTSSAGCTRSGPWSVIR